MMACSEFSANKPFFHYYIDDTFRFFPVSLTIEVKSRTIPEIIFSQLKATVSGKVNCIIEKDCQNLRVLFRQILKGSSDGYEIIAEVLSKLRNRKLCHLL